MYQEVFIHITAGRGPEECGRVVYHCWHKMKMEWQKAGLHVELEFCEKGRNPNTLKSALVCARGHNAESIVAPWQGTIQWIGQSPFRKYHKRKNWFIGVSMITKPKQIVMPTRLEFTPYKASGPGGQHRNKVSSAMRVTDLDSGLSVTASESRSQHQNKATAIKRLHQLFEEQYILIQQRKIEEQWEKTLSIERGNAVKVFRGEGL